MSAVAAAELAGVEAGGNPPHFFIVPAYNEEENLPRLLQDLEARSDLFPEGSRILVVDDGSEDGTVDVVRSYAGALELDLLPLPRNQGPGAAFRAAFLAVLAHCPEDALLITLEADSTGDLDALPVMLERARAGADLVLADWVMEDVSRRRRFLSAAAGVVVRLLLGLEAKTVSSFFRVYRASALRAALAHHGDGLIREAGFACKAELLAKLADLGARIEEVPVGLDTSKRIGKSKMPVLKTILAYWRMIARQRLARSTAA